jgi:hypothetical protein
VYIVTFSLAGFQTVKRQNVELPTDFTATINAEMKVGAIEESVTVSAVSPVVDVQSASHMQVLNREAMDEIPTGRTIQGLGQLIVGVSLSLPDTGWRARDAADLHVDARPVGREQHRDGRRHDGERPDVGRGRPKLLQRRDEPGGRVSDERHRRRDVGGRRAPQHDPERRRQPVQRLLQRGVSPRTVAGRQPQRSPQDRTPGLRAGGARPDRRQRDRSDSGLHRRRRRADSQEQAVVLRLRPPLLREQLHRADVHEGRGQGVDDQFIKSIMARITWQISPRNKFSAYNDEIDKYRGHDMQALYDPETAATVWNSPAYHTNQAKWTSTVTNKLMIDAGFSSNLEYYTNEYREGIAKLRNTADWFASASRSELDLGGRKTAATVQLAHNPARYNIQAAATYVTGSHNIKVGFQRTWGTFTHSYDANADLTQQYRSNSTGLPYTVPNSVVIRNTPLTDFGERLNYDLGIFAQDAWTMRRLTINAGIRWEALNAQVLEGNSPAGRFVPTRHFDAIEDLPNWRDWAPRFSAVYDLRGDAKTALKFSLNRYNQQRTTGIADSYNALVSATSASLAWTDLNKDDIAQGARGCVYLTTGCEINFTQLSSNFGNAALNRYGNFPRTWNLESAIELQHELMPRLSVSGSWFHGTFHNLTSTYHTEWTYADYTPINIFNPMTGTPITVYNRSAAANSRPADILDSFDPERQRIYNSYSFDSTRGRAAAPDLRRAVGRTGTERQLHAAGQPELHRFLRRTSSRGRLLDSVPEESAAC